MTLVVAAMFLVLLDQSRNIATMKREIAAICYEDILECYMPGMTYEETENETMMEALLSYFFPAASEEKQTAAYETQVESSLSYEMILAREAADENYVDDETGEVVFSGEHAAENAGEGAEKEADASGGKTGETSGEETEKAGETDGAGNAEETASIAETAAGTGLSETQETASTYTNINLEKLQDFDYLVQNFYQIDSTTTIDASQLNVDALLGKNMQLTHDASTPQILIYHTHSQEGYADSVEGDAGTTVVGVGEYLTKLLTEQYGLSVIHHTGEYDVGDRDHAYSNAAPAVEQLLADNPTIEVVIDLHRDGVREDTRLVTEQNGVQMAQIMFFNGLSRTTSTGDIDYLYNPYIADNLAISFQMQLKAAEYYPSLTRRIYLKGYRYNMHYCPKTLLIEVGAQTNTVQEAMNSMVPLADILNKVLTGTQ